MPVVETLKLFHYCSNWSPSIHYSSGGNCSAVFWNKLFTPMPCFWASIAEDKLVQRWTPVEYSGRYNLSFSTWQICV